MASETSAEDVLRYEVDKLRQEITSIKEVRAAPHPVQDLTDSVNQLRDSINVLISVFEKAERIVKNDTTEDKLVQVMVQNKQIADGIIMVANIIREQRDAEPAQVEEVVQESMDMFAGSDETVVQDAPEIPPAPTAEEFPIPPSFDSEVPAPPPKKGFFSKFKK